MENKQFRRYLAVDLGAECGRIILGSLNLDPPFQKLGIEEIHRIDYKGNSAGGFLYRDSHYLFQEIQTGIKKAAGMGHSLSGISVSASGFDSILFSKAEPFNIRPLQFQNKRVDVDLEKAESLLSVADYFNYLLSGVARFEITAASTTKMYNSFERGWAWDVIGELGLPKKLFQSVVPAGTILGPLSPNISRQFGIMNVKVVATCSHDTAATVAAIPSKGENWAFLSAGAESLLGTEVRSPIINSATRKYNFTNKMGYAGTTMLCKNLVGLGLVQECRRAWSDLGKDFSDDDLTRMAVASEPLVSLIQPESPCFSKPGSMPDKVAEYCRDTDQPIPKGQGAIIRCILESLALMYAKTLEECESVSSRLFSVVHLVGGGSRNHLLNQFAANAMGLRLLAGPDEATAIGNILIQAKTMVHLAGDLRYVVAASFPIQTYMPRDKEIWKKSLDRFKALPVEPESFNSSRVSRALLT